MIAKRIIKNYFIKRINNELKRQIKNIYKIKLKTVIDFKEFSKIQQVVEPLYKLNKSDINIIIWELLGTSNYNQIFTDWLNTDINHSEIINDIDIGLINELRFKIVERTLE